MQPIQSQFAELESRGTAEMQGEGLVGESVRSADLRYVGQGYELNVAADDGMLEEFHALHQRRFGYADAKKPVEIVNLRVRFTARTEPFELPSREPRPGNGEQATLAARAIYFDGKWLSSRVYDRGLLVPGDCFAGPALITEYTATTVLPPGCIANVDRFGNLVIDVETEVAHA